VASPHSRPTVLKYGAWDEPMIALELWFSIQIQITCL
jgi:hypothetical protein